MVLVGTGPPAPEEPLWPALAAPGEAEDVLFLPSRSFTKETQAPEPFPWAMGH